MRWNYYKLRQLSLLLIAMDSYYKMRQVLQSATRFITNCDRYYKMRWVYYKMRRQVSQSAMIITNCDSPPPPPTGISFSHQNFFLARSNAKSRSFFLWVVMVNLTIFWVRENSIFLFRTPKSC